MGGAYASALCLSITLGTFREPCDARTWTLNSSKHSKELDQEALDRKSPFEPTSAVKVAGRTDGLQLRIVQDTWAREFGIGAENF